MYESSECHWYKGEGGSQDDDDANGRAMCHDIVSLQVDSHEDGHKDMGDSHLDACLNPQEAPPQPVNSEDSDEGGANIDCKQPTDISRRSTASEQPMLWHCSMQTKLILP